MSTSLLYHGFGIRDHAYQRTEYRGGATIFHVPPKDDALRCPCCRSRNVIRKGTVDRTLRGVPIVRMPVGIQVPMQRVGCHECGVIRQIRVQFADPDKSYTRAFERYVRDLCGLMALSDVAALVGVSWGLVQAIYSTTTQITEG